MTEKRKREFSGFLSRLRESQSGLALVEFAFGMPVLMGLSMYGSELSFLAITQMRVSQAALNLSDNASRLGQTDTGIASPTIRESNINEIFVGTRFHTERLDLTANGRIALTSLEVRSDDQQFISWQRCLGSFDGRTQKEIQDGKTDYGSRYDDDKNNDGVVDEEFDGMGKVGAKVQATKGSAIMFVEIEYNHTGLFGSLFIKDRTIREEAAFNIRDDRNLSAGLFDDVSDLDEPQQIATCDKFSTDIVILEGSNT